jgi:GNAT superfamily N-acetyltransferase
VTPRLRPYADGDWEAVLDLCLLAFAQGCESLERLAGSELDWRTSIERYLRSLTRSGEKKRLVVAEIRGSVVGVVHYEVDRGARSGRIGVSAVHPARQGKGIGPLMYDYVLEAMRAQGLRYATADTAGGPAHSRARRAYEKVGFVALPMVQYFMKLGDSRAGVPRRGPGRKRQEPTAARSRSRHGSGETR